jgi:hypothetical protein
MIAYWQIHHSILNYLKEWNEAGVIGAIAAAGTLAAVIVALLPTIKTWWTRPKLVLEIPPNAFEVSEQPFDGTRGAVTVLAGPRGAPLFPSAYWRAVLALRNTGRTAAVGLRVVITDVYRVTDSGKIATVDFSQRTLPGDGELPSRLVARFLLLSRARVANHDSGFVFGPLSHVMAGNIVGMQVTFTPGRPDLTEVGNYLLRVVTAASNVRAKTHVVEMGLQPDGLIKLSFPNVTILKALRRLDRARHQPSVSHGV